MFKSCFPDCFSLCFSSKKISKKGVLLIFLEENGKSRMDRNDCFRFFFPFYLGCFFYLVTALWEKRRENGSIPLFL